jgi:hypothetical protein
MAIGWLLVGCYAALLLVAVVTTEDTDLPPGARPDDGAVAEDFIASWERAGNATFLRTGTFERRSQVTGSAISSEDVLVQRPPQRLHRQLGGVSGRDDRRLLVCPSAPAGAPENECSLGDPTGPTYAEDLAAEVAALQTLLTGSTALYAVGAAEAGCFDLVQVRVEPRAPFGREAHFCFDPATGAPTNSRVSYEGGIVEVIAVTDLQGDVADDDLQP